MVSTERDNYKAELDALQEDYSGLYDSFERARKIAEDQKLETQDCTGRILRSW